VTLAVISGFVLETRLQDVEIGHCILSRFAILDDSGLLLGRLRFARSGDILARFFSSALRVNERNGLPGYFAARHSSNRHVTRGENNNNVRAGVESLIRASSAL